MADSERGEQWRRGLADGVLEGEVVKLGGARGAPGEANGDDQKPAAPVWHGHASGGHGSGHADIGMVLFLSS